MYAIPLVFLGAAVVVAVVAFVWRPAAAWVKPALLAGSAALVAAAGSAAPWPNPFDGPYTASFIENNRRFGMFHDFDNDWFRFRGELNKDIDDFNTGIDELNARVHALNAEADEVDARVDALNEEAEQYEQDWEDRDHKKREEFKAQLARHKTHNDSLEPNSSEDRSMQRALSRYMSQRTEQL